MSLLNWRKIMMENRREQLIRQMRTALNDLQSPAFFDHNETLTFTIGDLDYEFDEESLKDIQI